MSASRPADLDALVAPALARPARARLNRGAAVLVALFFAMLAFPLAAGLFRWHLLGTPDERRVLAKAPHWPRSVADLLALPGRLTALADDRFGYRNELVWLDGRLRYRLFGEVDSDQVMFGRHGRLWLISHVRGKPFSLPDEVCGVGVDSAQIADAARTMARVLDGTGAPRKGPGLSGDPGTGALAPRSLFVAIPTAPVLYPEDLPRWLAARCRNGTPSAPAVRSALAAARPDLGARMLYPLDTMLAVKQRGVAIAPGSFHWSGEAAKAVVEAIGASLALPKLRDIAARPEIGPADLSNFVPGVTLRGRVDVPDFAAAGVTACRSISCVPGFASLGDGLREAGHFRWSTGEGKKLVLVSDSFGARAAGYFCEYFSDVLYVNIEYRRLDPERRARLREALFARFRPDVLVMLFHDGGVRDVSHLVETALLRR
jgi:hypothetical protein